MSTINDPVIRRRPDGSIDFDHYDCIASDLRAQDQRAALQRLIAPVKRLLVAEGSESLRVSETGATQ